ncbi:hypothetical protein [Puerhibacterium sp. TATVAM-FAB25]|uniref:hypothetical protein n=1 Tax=Puerhibacterium sp. TATVAM-FAB25 TaxID=3093699 RepID=UPI0039799F88
MITASVDNRYHDQNPLPRARRRGGLGRTIVGGLFLTMGGVHLGLVAADPQVYGPFADGALFDFVRDGWADIVMTAPAVYGLLLMAGEVALGICLLAGGTAAKVGWVGVIAFHVLLVLFGWWTLAWVAPALAVIVPLAWRDLRAEQSRAGTVPPPVDVRLPG